MRAASAAPSQSYCTRFSRSQEHLYAVPPFLIPLHYVDYTLSTTVVYDDDVGPRLSITIMALLRIDMAVHRDTVTLWPIGLKCNSASVQLDNLCDQAKRRKFGEEGILHVEIILTTH